jgi:hypothetical protein
MCGQPCTESHHLFFGQWMSYWQLQTNHHFYIASCLKCHTIEPFAPHVNLKMFWVKLEVGLRRAGQGDLWKIIKAQHDDLYNGRFLQKARSDPKPDKQAIYNWLVEEYNELEQTKWMDMDCQEVIHNC